MGTNTMTKFGVASTA